MDTVGIICEYNPLHLGHEKQLRMIREQRGSDAVIVCLMSGNFVQRGAPAIVDKSLRAKAAVLCGADLVLELPVTRALSSAEGFAAGGVAILGQFCDALCFGSENGDPESLMRTAEALLCSRFPALLKEELARGVSFPAARASALEKMGVCSALLKNPNDILAVEYCKAIASQGCAMVPFPIPREGRYHAQVPDSENPSATALRNLMTCGHGWLDYVPPAAREVFRDAPLHTTAAGERAILARLRTMTDAEFASLPYGAEGLWRKFMHACRSCGTLEEILTATKSKRYTRSRLDRMAMCAFLGITEEMLESPAPYVRVLALNDAGRAALKRGRANLSILNAGDSCSHPFGELESRCGDLYGLFCRDNLEPPGAEDRRRVCYCREGI